MVIFDTSVIIDHLRRPPEDSRLIKFDNIFPDQAKGLAMASIQELYTGKSITKQKNERILLSTIAPFSVYPYTYEVAKLAGVLTRNSNSQMEFADATIAATAILNGSKLFTLNTKHFTSIPDLELLKLIK